MRLPSAVAAFALPVAVAALAVAVCAQAAGLVPDDFVNDNAGGICRWDTKGAPFQLLGGAGPEGRSAVRISGTTDRLWFGITGLRLAAGGRFRLAADVRTKGLESLKRLDLLVYNESWRDEETVDVPRDTAGEWQRISREFTMPKSSNGQYSLAFYASEAFAKGASLDISGVRLEPLDEKAAAGSVLVGAPEPFKPRISPVDPLLNDVDAEHARLTFLYPADTSNAEERFVLRARMLGRSVTGEFGGDHKAVVDFGRIDRGYRRIDLEVVGEKSGRVFASNGYTIKANAPVKDATAAKKLNNFVSELFTKPLKNGEIQFSIAKRGWVYVTLDRPYPGVSVDVDHVESALRFRKGEPSETQRLLSAGRHVLRVRGVDDSSKGGTLSVRLVKIIGGASMARAVAPNTDYLNWGYSRGYYERFGLFTTMNDAELSAYGNRAIMRVWADLVERGMTARFAHGPSALHHSRNSIASLYEAVASNPAFGRGVPLALDENAISAPPQMKYNYAEVAWLLGEKCPDMAVWYADALDAQFTRPLVDIPEMSAILNSGEGNGITFPEAYYIVPNTEEEWAKLAEWIKLQRRQLRDEVPAAPTRFVYALSGWAYPGVWTTRHRPHVDPKAFYSRLMRMFATDPEFADMGGVSFTSPICDEDLLRFYYDAARHYCLEGRTDDFAEGLGYRMFTDYLGNGDFDDGLAGWEVSAAEAGSVQVGHKKGFGRRSQKRTIFKGDTAAGDHFALLKRSARAPNVLRQRMAGLKPGGLYQISLCSMYHEDMIKPGSARSKAGVRVSVSGAECIDDLEHVVRLGERDPKKPPRTAIFAHRVVFRATAETAELSVSDWLGAAAPGGEVGELVAFNYVGCTAYYVRDASDLEALSAINLATGKGARP